jgi:hypothetical protein
MNAFEIIAGFALLLGWRIKLFSWLLLILILFFTFLTGYTFITGMPKNCGCFGDCLPISSQTSFLKDVVLTIMIGFLFWQQKHIKPFLSKTLTTIKMVGVTILAFGFQWYTLNYMPVVDCMPFKKGNNIPEKMKMPANAIPDSTVITFVYEKAGKQVEFTADQFPADFSADTYKFISRYDKVIKKGKNNEPPIKGFALTGVSGEDSTQVVLTQPNALLLFYSDFSIPVSKWEKKFGEVYAAAKAKNIPIYLVTSQPGEVAKAISKTSFAGIQIFSCDFTAIRTAARVSPNLYLLENGNVKNKWSRYGLGAALKAIEKLKAVPDQPVTAPDVSPTPVLDTTTNQ